MRTMNHFELPQQALKTLEMALKRVMPHQPKQQLSGVPTLLYNSTEIALLN